MKPSPGYTGKIPAEGKTGLSFEKGVWYGKDDKGTGKEAGGEDD